MNWPLIQLRNESLVITKGTTPTSVGFGFSDTGVPFVRVQNLIDGTILTDNDPLFIDLETHNALKRSKIYPGDLLISIAGTIGKTAIVPDCANEEMNCNQAIAIIRPTKRLDKKYLRYWLETEEALTQITRGKVTATISNLSLGQIGALQLPLPPLAEQKRIAVILDQADSQRRLRQRAIDRLNSLGQAIFHEMFGDPGSNPKNYPLRRLGEVADVRDGTHDSPVYVDEGYPLLTSKNFTSGKLSFEGAKFISDKDYRDINRRSKVDIGDIVMPMIGTIGSPVVIEEDPNFAIKNVALIKFGNSELCPWYVNAILSGPFLEHHVSARGRGGTQQFVSLGDLRSLEIPVPSKGEQIRFSERLNSLKSSVKAYKIAADKIERLFSSLQHRAFRGEL